MRLERHLHREGLVGERRDRPAAPLGHLGAAHPARRDRGGVGVVHLRPRLARGVPRPAARRARRARSTTSASILRKLVDMQYERNDMNLVRGKFRVRGDTIEVHPAYDETAVRIELFGDEVERITVVDPLTGEQVDDARRAHRLPGHPLRRRRGAACSAAIDAHRGGAAGAAGLLREGGQAARGPAPAHAHPVRPRDDAGGRLLQRHRELLGARSTAAARARRRNTLLDFFPDDFLVVIDESHAAVPAAPRPVRGRPLPQGDADRARVPPAVGGRQPAAALRGVHRAGRPGRVPVGHARARTSCEHVAARSSSRSCGPPAWSTPRSS